MRVGRRARARSALPRHKRGKMNKTEERYAALLDARVLAGGVDRYWFEPGSWRVREGARACHYTPDFMVQLADHSIEMVDVKGAPAQDDALVKAKVCAAEYPLFLWVWESWKGTRKGWERREF